MSNRESNIAQFIWPLVILLLGLILTGVVWRYTSIKDDEASLAQFDRHARNASHDVQKRIEAYFGVLHSVGAFFSGSNQATCTEFEKFVSFLKPKKNYPGIEGMGVIRYIPDSQKREFENAVRHQNNRDITGQGEYTIRPPGVREFYYPVECFWPPSANINLPGLDHGAYPAGFKALQMARDTGLVTMSAKLPYAQGSNNNPPILLIFPVYRNGWPITTLAERQKALWGFVYARVNIEELFQDVLGPSVTGEIYLEVFDGGYPDQGIPGPDKTRLIYDADPSDIPHALDTSYKPRHHTMQKVAMDGIRWIFYTSSRPGGIVEQRDDMPLFILLVGGFLSIGTSVVVFLRNRGNRLIHQLAYYDHLTCLPNRRLFQDRFQQALANARRHGTEMALLFLDLDKFKPINDSLGHEAGDQVLKAVAARLTCCLREGDTLARLGGDEFAVLLLNIAGEQDASSVAQKIMDTISETIVMKGQDLQVGCSIGISIFPKDGTNYDALLKNADAAMYRAKEAGRNNFQFYAAA